MAVCEVSKRQDESGEKPWTQCLTPVLQVNLQLRFQLHLKYVKEIYVLVENFILQKWSIELPRGKPVRVSKGPSSQGFLGVYVHGKGRLGA